MLGAGRLGRAGPRIGRAAGRRRARRPASSSSTTSPVSRPPSADGDVAAVLFEPALTNVGIVLPEPGYHEAVREITRRTGTLLIIDETHTICAGPGGAIGAWGLEPDLVVIGKTIGGGIPSAAYGFSPERRGAGRAARSRSRIPMSAGSAARSPDTPSRWPRPGRRSARS